MPSETKTTSLTKQTASDPGVQAASSQPTSVSGLAPSSIRPLCERQHNRCPIQEWATRRCTSTSNQVGVDFHKSTKGHKGYGRC